MFPFTVRIHALVGVGYSGQRAMTTKGPGVSPVWGTNYRPGTQTDPYEGLLPVSHPRFAQVGRLRHATVRDRCDHNLVAPIRVINRARSARRGHHTGDPPSGERSIAGASLPAPAIPACRARGQCRWRARARRAAGRRRRGPVPRRPPRWSGTATGPAPPGDQHSEQSLAPYPARTGANQGPASRPAAALRPW